MEARVLPLLSRFSAVKPRVERTDKDQIHAPGPDQIPGVFQVRSAKDGEADQDAF